MSTARDLRRNHDHLGRVVDILGWPDDRLYLRLEHISAWSIAQHVDHLLLALDLVIDRVERLETAQDREIERRARPRWAGRLILLTGWIPRGRGEAPERVVPDRRPVRPRMRAAADRIGRRLPDLEERTAALAGLRGGLPHPVLGTLDAEGWIRFGEVHTRHHLAIVKEIDRYRAIGVQDALPVPPPAEEPEVGVHPGAP